MTTVTMYDDVTLALIPPDAEAVAGYVNGRWPTYPEVLLHFPHAHHLSIAVNAHVDAECLDVEPGDAGNADAPAWVRRQMARGVRRPVVYTSTSNAAALVRTLALAGIRRGQYRLWTAHYTGREHLCGPACGFGSVNADATQWTDRSHGRSLDQTLCGVGFFDPPKPRPRPVPSDVFAHWAEWIRGGKKWRRPGRAPKRIPLSWWKRLPAWLKAHSARRTR